MLQGERNNNTLCFLQFGVKEQALVTKHLFKKLQKARRILGAVLVICFMFFYFLGIFGMNMKHALGILLWMMVSFASVTGCRIDEPRPNFTVPEHDIYEFLICFISW